MALVPWIALSLLMLSFRGPFFPPSLPFVRAFLHPEFYGVAWGPLTAASSVPSENGRNFLHARNPYIIVIVSESRIEKDEAEY